jgi:small conductance mechanosensitive channel
MQGSLSTLDQAKLTLIDVAIRFGPKLLVAIVILIAGVAVGAWVSRALDRSLRRMELEPPLRQLMTRLAHVLVFGLFLILALENLGVQLLPLVAGLGVAGAGVALATQGVLGNAVAGLTIIFSKPYRVGDYIAIVGVEGQVEAITVFNTALLHSDRSRVIVPNRKIVGEILHNYGRLRQSEVQVSLPYGSDLTPLLALLGDLARTNARVLAEPAPCVGLSALGESAVAAALKVWVRAEDYGVVEGELYLAITQALSARGIAIPYPQRHIRLLGVAPESARAPAWPLESAAVHGSESVG